MLPDNIITNKLINKKKRSYLFQMSHKYFGSFSVADSTLTLNIESNHPKKWNIISINESTEHPRLVYNVERSRPVETSSVNGYKCYCGTDYYSCSIHQDGEYVVIDKYRVISEE